MPCLSGFFNGFQITFPLVSLRDTDPLPVTGIKKASLKRLREAPPGFEPGNNGFAIRRLRPLGYGALIILLSDK